MTQGLSEARSARYLRTVFDTIPHPAFIVGPDIRIQEFNTAAGELLGPSPQLALQQRSGDAFHCIHSEPAGCGHSEPCRECVIRNSVNRALEGGVTCRRMHKAKLRRPEGLMSIDLLISASPLPQDETRQVLLLLEDVTELLALRDLIPICAYCKKVRDDEQYWQAVDTYLSKHMNLRLTHSLCPDCYKEEAKKIEAM